MILATHAVVGTIIATSLTTNPYIALGIGFASHFLIDPIPHWDYTLHSLKKDPGGGKLNHDMEIGRIFIFDLMRISTDALIGATISFVIAFYVLDITSIPLIIASVIGGILPDPLQFVYWKTRSKFLLPLQIFHKNIHSKIPIKSHRLGIPLQILTACIFLGIAIAFK